MWYVQVKYECLSTKTEPGDDGQIVTGVPHIDGHFLEKKTSLAYSVHSPRKYQLQHNNLGFKLQCSGILTAI